MKAYWLGRRSSSAIAVFHFRRFSFYICKSWMWFYKTKACFGFACFDITPQDNQELLK